MDQIRATFLVFLTIAAVGAGSAAYMSSRTLSAPADAPSPTQQTLAPQTAADQQPADTRVRRGAPPAGQQVATTATVVVVAQPDAQSVKAPTMEPVPSATATRPLPEPIFAPEARVSDVLPALVCGASNAGGHLTLLHMQAAGLDVAYGFHLGIVPFNLDAERRASEVERAAWLRSGDLDCALTSIDAVAVHDAGIVTALIGESTAAQQLWARQAQTVSALAGLRIAYEAGGASEAFVRALPVEVTYLPQPTLDDAVRLFNNGEADAVAGWEPGILDAEAGGGRPLANTSSIYPVIDVIAVSRRAARSNPVVLDQFHAAWFDALQQQATDLTSAAGVVAAWGNNAWSGISSEDAADDWLVLQRTANPAGLSRNSELMAQPDLLLARLNAARLLWSNAPPGANFAPAGVPVHDAVDSRYVQAAARALWANAAEALDSPPSEVDIASADEGLDQAMTGAPQPNKEVASDLRCPRIAFAVELNTGSYTVLSSEVRRVLDMCAVTPLQQAPGTLLRISGSSAWPGPAGTYTRAQVLASARRRAEAVMAYLISRGVERRRLMLVAALPPAEHRESDDLAVQAQDRYVEITLLAPAP
jgi:ABC-type amino acid transport substrate-binding protein/outer membrane protein OmpA-like peptidoglycan-associated protein